MSLTDILTNQYFNCFAMLSQAITNYNEDIWFDDKHYKSPVWQIVYHTLFYTNIYCSATENGILHWPKERDSYHRFEIMHELRASGSNLIQSYTKGEMIEFSAFVKGKVPIYLADMEPDARCWPYWYEEPQIEFHINNIRHIQHHLGEIIERHDIRAAFEYDWK